MFLMLNVVRIILFVNKSSEILYSRLIYQGPVFDASWCRVCVGWRDWIAVSKEWVSKGAVDEKDTLAGVLEDKAWVFRQIRSRQS